MPKCSYCNKKVSLGNFMNCKWCKSFFCIGCLGIEMHKCENAHICKSEALKHLKNKLQDGKTVQIKI